MSTTLDILLWVAAAIWLFSALSNAVFGRRLTPLDALRPDWDEDPLPTVSAIVPARDEAERIEQTVQSFLSQTAVDLQLLVIDDRSSDDTMDVLERLAGNEPRLEPIRIDTLPEGWLGKCHALHIGAQQAKGEWLLFADADTTFLAPDTLRRAIDLACAHGADHVCLIPRIPARTVWAKAAACGFIMSAARRIDRVNQDKGQSFFGAGAFNLVHTETYRSFGGHTPLKLEVLDDINLGALVRRGGGRSRLRTAFNDMETSWGATICELVAVLEKNMFAFVGYRPLFLLAIAVAFSFVWGVAMFGPVWSLLTGSPAPMIASTAMLLAGASTSRITRQLGFSLTAAFLAPIVSITMIYAGVRSMFITLRRGGVRWRDTFYPLAELRAGRFRQLRSK